MSKTLIATNILDSVNSEVYGSHCQTWFRLGRNTSDEFILFHPHRMTIDAARNSAAQIAMRNSCDYIWFIDSDMILSAGTYESLKSRDAEVAMAQTYIRSHPFREMFFKMDGNNLRHYDDWWKDEKDDGTVECDAVGFACALIKVAPLYKINPPYFITGTLHTEDVYYCLKLKDKFPGARIVMDTKVPTGHQLNPEFISAKNINEMRARHPIIEQNVDRGIEYVKSVKQVFEDRKDN